MRRLTLAAAAAHPPATAADVGRPAGTLWREAAYREERYAAIALTGLPVARGALELLPLYEEMITTGAWWDLVDGVAGRIRDLLLAHPAQLAPVLRDWARSPDRWLRRSAVIAQLGARERTDRTLLTEVIEVERRGPGVLRPQGDRLGPARPGEDRPGVGARLPRRARAEPAVPAGSRQAPLEGRPTARELAAGPCAGAAQKSQHRGGRGRRRPRAGGAPPPPRRRGRSAPPAA